MAESVQDEEDMVRVYIQGTIAHLNELIIENQRHGMTPDLLRYCIEKADGLFPQILEDPNKVSDLGPQLIEIHTHIHEIQTRMMSSILDLEMKRAALLKAIKADYENFMFNLLRYNNLVGTLNSGIPEKLHQPNFGIPSNYERMVYEVSDATDPELRRLISGYYNKNAGSAPLAQSEIHNKTLLLKSLSQQIINSEDFRNTETTALPQDLVRAMLSAAEEKAKKLIDALDSVPDPINSIVRTVDDKVNAIMKGFYGICSMVIFAKTLSGAALNTLEQLLQNANAQSMLGIVSDTDSGISKASAASAASDVPTKKQAIAINYNQDYPVPANMRPIPPMQKPPTPPSENLSVRSNKSEVIGSIDLQTSTSIKSASVKINALMGIYDENTSSIASSIVSRVSGRRSIADLVNVRSIELSIPPEDSNYLDTILESFNERASALERQLAASVPASGPASVASSVASSEQKSEVSFLIETYFGEEIPADQYDNVLVGVVDPYADNDAASSIGPGDFISPKEPDVVSDMEFSDHEEEGDDEEEDEDGEEEGDDEEEGDTNRMRGDTNRMPGGKRKTRRNKRSIKKRANKKARTTRRKRAAKTRRAPKKRRSSKKRRTTRKR